MDLYTLALSIAYTNKAINEAELEVFKVQVETTRDILETVGEEKTFYFLPKVVSEPQNGYDEYIYVNDSWELMGGTDIDLSGYMTLAPFNPTTAEIEAMPGGQIFFSDEYIGVAKSGYNQYPRKAYIDRVSDDRYVHYRSGYNGVPVLARNQAGFYINTIWRKINEATYSCKGSSYVSPTISEYSWNNLSQNIQTYWGQTLPSGGTIQQFDDEDLVRVPFYTGDLVKLANDPNNKVYKCHLSYELTNFNLPLVYTYTWEEYSTNAELASEKMDLVLLNPTAQEINALPSGQLYSDTVNHKGVIKGEQEFYDTRYIDDRSVIIITSETVPESVDWDEQIPTTYAGRTGEYPQFALWEGYLWYLYEIDTQYDSPTYYWEKIISSTALNDAIDTAIEEKDIVTLDTLGYYVGHFASLSKILIGRYDDDENVVTFEDLRVSKTQFIKVLLPNNNIVVVYIDFVGIDRTTNEYTVYAHTNATMDPSTGKAVQQLAFCSGTGSADEQAYLSLNNE